MLGNSEVLRVYVQPNLVFSAVTAKHILNHAYGTVGRMIIRDENLKFARVLRKHRSKGLRDIVLLVVR
jgi:hypothetical protein